MVAWIVVAVVLLSLVFLGLVLRVLLWRLAGLKEAAAELQLVAVRAQELVKVAEGLQAHGDSLRVRLELTQERINLIKESTGSLKIKRG
ncbi:hypothetical protein [Catellatospora citrea]|uniref:Uncharacterized protein n=1 Tax=Catellatospora citrea TaxID=53366 RepID=A0A8J3P2S1_9ACTN|nr:hypothetical protein [Catellatospora citrea]RKE06470.1 hypothetical protein C8E86_1290 [Catellatospora citrea]GIG01773.1 hypothetical protein Cci01nite_68660 [Catellatospora citrea]